VFIWKLKKDSYQKEQFQLSDRTVDVKVFSEGQPVWRVEWNLSGRMLGTLDHVSLTSNSCYLR
jgi:hypothetical protein